jgi:hypothetical protein
MLPQMANMGAIAGEAIAAACGCTTGGGFAIVPPNITRECGAMPATATNTNSHAVPARNCRTGAFVSPPGESRPGVNSMRAGVFAQLERILWRFRNALRENPLGLRTSATAVPVYAASLADEQLVIISLNGLSRNANLQIYGGVS